MTDSMKCPFCNADLIVHTDKQMAVCRNPKCKYDGWHFPVEIIQRMIDGKKAQDALKVARNLYQDLALAYCEMVDDYRTTYGRLKTPEQEAQEYMQEYDEKISSITKQENEK